MNIINKYKEDSKIQYLRSNETGLDYEEKIVDWVFKLQEQKLDLKTELEIKYGSLLQELETTFDWFEKAKIQKKLNAINCLLDIPYIQESSLYTIGIDKITSEKNNVGPSIFQGKDYIDLHNNKNKEL